MMKKITVTLLLLLITVSAWALEITVPEQTVQGGVITVLLSDLQDIPAGSPIVLSFGDGEAIQSRTEAFNFESGGREVFIGLLGVPSTLAPGAYKVSARMSSDVHVEKVVRVVSKEFIKEEIPLSRSMSSLRQSDDVRKAEQWRNLLVILKTVEREHIYEEGRLVKPVEPLRISSFYGDRRTFKYDDGSSARSIHNGIDYSAETGTPIFAAGRGRVVFAGERIISGNTAVIEHLPGVYSLYYHMNSLKVTEGQMIEAGFQVGTVGSTGLVTGAHLHWEVRVAGVAVDPGPLMSSGLIDKDFILSKIKEH